MLDPRKTMAKKRVGTRPKRNPDQTTASPFPNLGPISRRGLAERIDQAGRSTFQALLCEELEWNIRFHQDAFRAFDLLVEQGCDPGFLLAMLGILRGAHRADSWESLTGFSSSKEFQSVLKRLLAGAGEAEKLLGSLIGRAASLNSPMIDLPNSLCNLANHAWQFRRLTPRRKPTQQFARAAITRHVKDRTGGFRDELVANVLQPLVSCTGLTQLQWRHDNPLLLIGPLPRA